MKLITVLLVAAVFALGWYGLRLHGTYRGGAFSKLGLVGLLVFAAYAVLRPDDVTWLAMRVGVGRGTDLVLYALVVGFGFFAVSTFLRFRALELRFTRLARTIALDRAEPLRPPPGTSADASATSPGLSAGDQPPTAVTPVVVPGPNGPTVVPAPVTGAARRS